ncbi:hypothetical protein KIP89_08215 [Ancylobacter sp. VKM B-3255]|uniref:Uncharacterized protein n=2 Tax=Ancylobacter radicis TaxID=2836179 RepID=A0ABS5R8D8_9HYPH|nr:hypothetical protein [Ancylobacter radicis]
MPNLSAAFLAGVLLAGVSLPAAAQWIGAPGGSDSTSTGDSGTSSSAPQAATPATPTMAPAAPAPMTAAPASPGFSSPGLSTDSFGGSPLPGSMGMMPGPATPVPAGPSPADMADCQTQVTKLRTDLENRNEALRKAASKKLPPSELCPMFRNFVSSQQRFYSYLVANKSKCGVPDEAIKGLKDNAGSVTSIRDKVCQAAAAQQQGGPSGPPVQGAVSQGLGLSSGLPSTATAKGGVFDTLGGDALR